ncbi:MAG: SsrA-binding protein SmpB [Candidatus Pacebacteria bacterium]|nr:SsrA-binding protein SmpB [Candidatus Paceibacterota bacterium]
MDPVTSTIAENRRGRFDYEIKEAMEAGIELAGFEVKSAKGGSFQIAGAHVLIRGGEAWLVNAHIPPYQPKNMPEGYEEDRARRLLLSRDEIVQLAGTLKDKSAHIIPLRAYLKHGYIKIEIGIGRSRRKSDKREALKKRAHNREMRAE